MQLKAISILFVSALLWATQAGSQESVEWRTVDPDRLVLMNLDEGQVLIELNPAYAPKTVAQFKRLVRDGFYNGQSFYRVIDGFVAQGGDGSDMGDANSVPTIKAEFEQPLSQSRNLAFSQQKRGSSTASRQRATRKRALRG